MRVHLSKKKLCQSDQKILSDLFAILPTLVVVHAHHRDFRHNLYLCIEALLLKLLCLLELFNFHIHR